MDNSSQTIVKKGKIKRVFVTRPAHQHVAWEEKLARHEVTMVNIPLLAIEPVAEEALKQKIKQQVLRLDEQDFVIFVSQNAVQYAFEWIEQYWPQFPVAVKMFCVGKKTEQVLRQTLEERFAIAGNVHSVDDASAMTSEALLMESGLLSPTNSDDKTLTSQAQLNHKKAMIFRGVGGRTTLQENLQAHGAIVEHCELYWRKLPLAAQADFESYKLQPGVDVVTVFSGETLQNLHQILQQLKLPGWQNLTLVVPSKRVQVLANDMGFNDVLSAVNASEASMWQTLEQLISSTDI